MPVMTEKYQTIMSSFSPSSHYNTNGEKETMYMQPYQKVIVPVATTYKCSLT